MRCVALGQAPGQSNPDVSFKLGPQDAPVAVTLGKQPGLDGGVDKVCRYSSANLLNRLWEHMSGGV